MSKVQIAMPLCGCKPFRIYMTGKYIASLHRAGAAVRLIRMTDPKLEEKLSKKLDSITTANWQMLPLHVEFQGAHVIAAE